MSIPEKCSVLVAGGGPGGSYAAAALAREGFDTVLLEADVHPRYHIGESMLPSIRHYLRFIDLDEEFKAHGFKKKVGAAFKLNQKMDEGYTDFIAAGGPENFSWNVIRSQADEMLFRHAEKCGAKAFDGVKVNSIEFIDAPATNGESAADEKPNPGRPVSASYTRKADGATGTVKFDYLIDATGRAGLLTSKYLKNRLYNQTLKNIATWGYWKNGGRYGAGTPRDNSPLFEALTDQSGWAWFIPLHDDTTSVGIVVHQDLMNKKKAAEGLSNREFFLESIKLAPHVGKLLENGELVTDVKSASDYSYNSSTYATPYTRVVGDAGCFIDPYFSSGVHLALTGALSAAATICAAERGDCDEETAGKWHTNKIREGYSRWLLVVLSAYRQIRNQKNPVLSEFGEDNFDRAFSLFKPIIQGTADATNKLSQAEFSQALDFIAKVFERPPMPPNGVPAIPGGGPPPQGKPGDEEKKFPEAPNGAAPGGPAPPQGKPGDDESKKFPAPPVGPDGKPLLPPGVAVSPEERMALEAMRFSQIKNMFNIQAFTTDVIDGRVPRLEQGRLGLIPAAVGE